MTKRRNLAGHLAWIRTLPSLLPGSLPVEAAHVRYADARYAKPLTGMQRKPDDIWVVPLAGDQHRAQHSIGERHFWHDHEIDPVVIAAFLFCHSGNDDAGRTIIRNARIISARGHREEKLA